MARYQVQIGTEATAYVEVEVDGNYSNPEVQKVINAEALNKASEIQLCAQCSGSLQDEDYVLALGEFDSIENVTEIT